MILIQFLVEMFVIFFIDRTKKLKINAVQRVGYVRMVERFRWQDITIPTVTRIPHGRMNSLWGLG